MSNSRARPPNRSEADPRPPLPVPTQEVHFLAEDEHLDIVPNFSLQGLHLLGGTVRPRALPSPRVVSFARLSPHPPPPLSPIGPGRAQYGPFRPQMRTSVPLWLAMLLKKQGKCSVVPPRWLDAATLRSVIEAERLEDVFQGLPHHYIEIATDLCKHAREDLEDWNALYDLVDTIRSVRHNKFQAGLRALDENALKGVKLTNLSAMEVSVIRPFMSNALDNFLEGTAGAE